MMRTPLPKSAGFSLMSAIFLVVVLSLIATFIVNLSSLNMASTHLGLQGMRAYYAARSGLEWALYVATTPVAGVYNCPTGAGVSSCPAGYTGTTNTLNFTQGGMKNFTVVVTCCQNLITEGTRIYNLYQLTATSHYGVTNSPDFVSRTLYFTATDPRG